MKKILFLFFIFMFCVKTNAIIQIKEIPFTQLTTPSVTSAINVQDMALHTFQIVVASITTNVVVRAEGSVDNTSWFNLDDDGNDRTITTDGTYFLHKSPYNCKYMRFRFVSESGGTNATIAAKYYGGR